MNERPEGSWCDTRVCVGDAKYDIGIEGEGVALATI